MDNLQSVPMAARKTRARRRGLWFAAHVVLYFDERRRRQATFVAWENVYLIFARNVRQAAKKAEQLGRAECVEDAGLTVNGRPARMVFGGVRKVLWCAANPAAQDGLLVPQVPVMYSGVEATFSEFVVRGRKQLRALIAGRPTRLDYRD